MKAIKKSTLFKLARIVRGYARTGDVELLFAKNETARATATTAVTAYYTVRPALATVVTENISATRRVSNGRQNDNA